MEKKLRVDLGVSGLQALFVVGCLTRGDCTGLSFLLIGLIVGVPEI